MRNEINKDDLFKLTGVFSAKSRSLEDQIDDALKDAQDHAYALGRARGREEANARYEPRPPLSMERLSRMVDSMPDGLAGFTKTWGWQQFARKIEQEHGIGIE